MRFTKVLIALSALITVTFSQADLHAYQPTTGVKDYRTVDGVNRGKVIETNRIYTDLIVTIAKKYAVNSIRKEMADSLCSFFNHPSTFDPLYQPALTMLKKAYEFKNDSIPLIDYVVTWYKASDIGSFSQTSEHIINTPSLNQIISANAKEFGVTGQINQFVLKQIKDASDSAEQIMNKYKENRYWNHDEDTYFGNGRKSANTNSKDTSHYAGGYGKR
jgi:hypothetical protein